MPPKKFILERRNPLTGCTEKAIYTGALSNKPEGWKLVGKIYR